MGVKKIIALYLRLSKHDKDIEEDRESSSIGNQREILKEYVNKHLDTVKYEVREFVDDGFSGTSMDRPAMQTLLKMVEEGKVYAIVVKDLSRFARNYLKSAYYMEKVFPAFGVRFICVNDSYDSDSITYQLPGMDMAFKGIIHDYYCKELSGKSKTARRQQVEKGKCIFAKPPYGYWKSRTEKGVLVIDENTAPIVKDIFNRYLQGMSAYGIAQELNRRGIPSPNNRLIAEGMLTFRNEQYAKGMCWNNFAVLSILRNQIYIGDMVGGKEERIKICDRNCKEKDREEWIIVEGTHEPIIDKEVFYQVQNMLQVRAKLHDRKTGGHTAFSGKLICGRCGGNMTRSGAHKGVEYYACPRCRMMGKKGATAHSDFLEKCVLEKIVGQTVPKELMQCRGDSASDDNSVKVCGEEGKIKNAKQRESQGRSLLLDYEMYAEGLITRDEYEERRRVLQEKAVHRTETLTLQSKAKITENIHAEREQEIFADDSRLTHEIVDYYVEKITVNGTEDIEIEWKQGQQKQVDLSE